MNCPFKTITTEKEIVENDKVVGRKIEISFGTCSGEECPYFERISVNFARVKGTSGLAVDFCKKCKGGTNNCKEYLY